jgi:hypothetical protein
LCFKGTSTKKIGGKQSTILDMFKVSGTPKSSFSVLRDPATDPVDAQGSIL